MDSLALTFLIERWGIFLSVLRIWTKIIKAYFKKISSASWARSIQNQECSLKLFQVNSLQDEYVSYGSVETQF